MVARELRLRHAVMLEAIHLYSILSIALPRAAADALDFAAIQRQAREDGFGRAARIEVNTYRAHGRTRITCPVVSALRVFVALRDVKRFHESRGRAEDVRLAREIDLAIDVVLGAVTAEMQLPQNMSPAAGIGRMARPS